MRRSAIALRAFIGAIARSIGLEGAFLLGGTGSLAVGASFITPAGPWLVVGVVSVLTGFALALPRREP